MSQITSPRFIRLNALASTPGKPGTIPASPATIWRWVKEGNFPRPIKLGPKTTVWNLDEIEVFLAQRAGSTA
jgi:predicted DNA-binding transcriptional regulator AlpA